MRTLLALLLLAASSALAALPPDEQALEHLKRLSTVFTPPPAQDCTLSSAVLITQAPGQLYQPALPPVWVARIRTGPTDHGYLMWEDTESGALLEFALDGRHLPSPQFGALTEGVPALQQFPVPGRQPKTVASGCVPTAGASLVAYWTHSGFPQWSGGLPLNQHETLEKYALRLRKKLNMVELPDTSGHTNDGMTLSGAYPIELAKAITKDARAHGVVLNAVLNHFSFAMLQTETAASRPVLLSCMVRLPQKPHLAWGHEMVGVGWLEFNGAQFAGVEDNFYPTASPETVRWIRNEAFQTLITAVPELRKTGRTAK